MPGHSISKRERRTEKNHFSDSAESRRKSAFVDGNIDKCQYFLPQKHCQIFPRSRKKWPKIGPLRAKNNPFRSQKFALAQTKVSFLTLKGNLSHPKRYLIAGLFLAEIGPCLCNSFVLNPLRKCENLAFYAPTEKFFQNFPATRASNKGVCQYFS